MYGHQTRVLPGSYEGFHQYLLAGLSAAAYSINEKQNFINALPASVIYSGVC